MNPIAYSGNVGVQLDPEKLAKRIATFLAGVPAIVAAPNDTTFDTYVNGLSAVQLEAATRAFFKAIVTVVGPPAGA